MNVDRAVPSHRPRKRVGHSRHARIRWWRIANDHLWRLVTDPVREWSTPEYRGIDLLDASGIRIHRRTGACEVYSLLPRGRQLQRRAQPGASVLLIGGDMRQGWIGGLISANARRWAELAGMPPAHINRQWLRLLRHLGRSWTADGTIDRMRLIMARALALDAEVVRLVLSTTSCEAGPDAVFLQDYNRCLADRANLLTVEREAPQLMRLYALLLPDGAGAEEPKKALKRTFLAAGGRPPRLWRATCRLAVDTIDALTAHGQCRYMHPLADLIDLLQALDLPVQPPDDWLLMLREGYEWVALSRMFEAVHSRPMLTAHLRAWMAAPAAARAGLSAELDQVDDHFRAIPTATPKGLRGWKWWVRQARETHAAHAQYARAVAREWDASMLKVKRPPSPPLRAADIELRRLLSAEALHEEGLAMDNCIHDWRDHLIYDSAAIYSIVQPETGEHIGTAALMADGAVEARGYANHPLKPEQALAVRGLLLNEHRRHWSGFESGGWS